MGVVISAGGQGKTLVGKRTMSKRKVNRSPALIVKLIEE
jgi:superfamily II DNA or RNA helicase